MRVSVRFRLLLVLTGICLSVPAAAQDRPSLFRGLMGDRGGEAPEALEEQARAERDASAAERIYATLYQRHPGTEPGIRAALWLGKRLYGVGREEQALAYFEGAIGRASDPTLRAEALFWAEQVHRATGQEPIASGDRPASGGYWDTLRLLVLVDRSLDRARPEEAETRLLSLEGSLRRHGLHGLDLARWGRLAQAGGGQRISGKELHPLVRRTLSLPERLLFDAGSQPVGESAEAWALQFGAFLERENARALFERLREQGIAARIDEANETGNAAHTVRLGRFATRAEADSAALELLEREAPPVRVVRIR